MDTKYIFVTGGVVSSLGKGIISSSLACLLKARGLRVTIQKFDPYINVDPGTLNPYEHGECYVTEDGRETDLDLGHYERFTNVRTSKANNVTTGRIYKSVIDKERRGDYLGKTVQIVPHITDEIKRRIKYLGNTGDYDFVITEIGGVVGDIESLPFLEAVRQLRWELGTNSLCVHLTYVPFIAAAQELKTKPTQHSVKALQELGIQPDILVLRTEKEVPADMRRKIALFCNVDARAVVQSRDASSIYKVPLMLHEQHVDEIVLSKTGVTNAGEPHMEPWLNFVAKLDAATEAVPPAGRAAIVSVSCCLLSSVQQERCCAKSRWCQQKRQLPGRWHSRCLRIFRGRVHCGLPSGHHQPVGVDAIGCAGHQRYQVLPRHRIQNAGVLRFDHLDVRHFVGQ